MRRLSPIAAAVVLMAFAATAPAQPSTRPTGPSAEDEVRLLISEMRAYVRRADLDRQREVAEYNRKVDEQTQTQQRQYDEQVAYQQRVWLIVVVGALGLIVPLLFVMRNSVRRQAAMNATAEAGLQSGRAQSERMIALLESIDRKLSEGGRA